MDQILAKRYAAALYETAAAAGHQTPLHEQFKILFQLITENKELALFFAHPRTKKDTQKEVIKTLAKKNFDPLLIQFLNLLIDKKRISLIEPICNAYEEIYFERNNIVKAKITSAVALSKEQVNMLVSKLKNQLHKEIIPEVAVDKSLLGGFKVNIDSKITDFSLSSQLKNFHSHIIHA